MVVPALRNLRRNPHGLLLLTTNGGHMTAPEFVAFPKIARLNRDITITEKLDGTNAAIGIRMAASETGGPLVWAQSRTRIIKPGDDNFGFAAWVEKNAYALARHLGEGLHFGEWWGVGIQRGYGLTERRFSLFNTKRWGGTALDELRKEVPNVYCVPVLYAGPWIAVDASSGGTAWAPTAAMEALQMMGSLAAGGYMKPEGIVIYHHASNQLFKATCEKDEAHKGAPNV